jgi:RNA polymerase sigma-70 factor (ECF subfamily)
MRDLKRSNHIDDLIQGVLLSVHKARFTYDPTKPFKPWLHAIIRYRMIDAIRLLRTSNKFEILYDVLPEAESPKHGDAEDEERLQNLKRALKALSGKQRKVVELLKLDGLSIKEVAHQCEMSESAVKVTAHRAYAQLRIRLEKLRHEP